jgi:hypothetical protein
VAKVNIDCEKKQRVSVTMNGKIKISNSFDDPLPEENFDLTDEFIRDVLLAKAEVDKGLVDDYEFDLK